MLPITFSSFVAPEFRSYNPLIPILCDMVDNLEAKQLKCNDEKRILLELVQEYDQNGKYINFIKESIRQ